MVLLIQQSRTRNQMKIDVSDALDEFEDTLTEGGSQENVRAARSALERWKDDPMLEDACRRRARELLARFPSR